MKCGKDIKKIATRVMAVWMPVGMLVTGGPPAAYADPASWSGGGIGGNPYIIASAEDLAALGNPANSGYWNACFEQTGDIVLPAPPPGASNWTPIGTSAAKFTGTYVGGGHTISNLTITNSPLTLVGLFG